MASASPYVAVEKEATCPICFEYLRDPVTVDCGHNFCQDCITKYCEEWELTDNLVCPVCRTKFQKGNFRRNWQLGNLVEGIKQLPRDLCLQHKEKLHLFCQEHNKLVCFVCERSPEHKGHTMILKEEAATEYKAQLSSHMEFLKKERAQILKYKEETEEEMDYLLELTKAEKEKMKTDFEQLHQILEEQEKHLRAQMEEAEKEIVRKGEENLARLSRELSCLGRLIQEMEQKFQQPLDEFLQDVQTTLQMSEKEESFQNPLVPLLELEGKLYNLCDRKPSLEAMMVPFRASWLSGSLLKKANVTLDPNTAHPTLVLSQDCKTVSRGDSDQDVPNSPERFDREFFVLGREGFRAGRHYWEVTVETNGYWALGVARKSVEMKDIILNTKQEIWAVGNQNHCTSWFTSRFLLFQQCVSDRNSFFPLNGEVRRIWVSLNCEGRRVSFHDADTGSHLHTFSGAFFSGETLLPFFWVSRRGSLTISP